MGRVYWRGGEEEEFIAGVVETPPPYRLVACRWATFNQNTAQGVRAVCVVLPEP